MQHPYLSSLLVLFGHGLSWSSPRDNSLHSTDHRYRQKKDKDIGDDVRNGISHQLGERVVAIGVDFCQRSPIGPEISLAIEYSRKSERHSPRRRNTN